MSSPSTRETHSPGSRADRRRQEIIDQAARLFEEGGYFGTTLDDIATTVGLRKATLYHYFSGKDEILNSIHEELLSWTMNREVARRQYDLPPEQHVLEIIADTLEVIGARPGHVRVFVEHHRELDPEAKANIAEQRDAYTSMVEQTIRKGIERGVFRPVDPTLAVLALFGACNWAYHWLEAEQAGETRQIAYALWDILMRGIQMDRSAEQEGSP